jgi:hypothetical protein
VLVFAVLVTVILLRLNLEKHEMIQKYLCCALGGITGSWIFAVKWYVRAISHQIWRYDLIAWRLTSPWMGIFLSVSAYAVIKAGFLGLTFQENQGVDPKLYAYAIGFMVGLFSDVVMGKLTEVANTLFGRTTPEEIGKTRS